ncbi:hypothetical protein [Pseudogemmobacter faecipullorum]|uniref:Uncharacterized protein n=1 Tax=Pseudogemmobacter faecipullorum TaxID=2755041 RepID=A0ABS8CM71_9RHOB|nr:hypothetical protein [Pseudogemmobacter faecipullorum]MCB5410485.1 hypothetical protein [Pseudogemmobacter faecipullorum]
MRATAILAALAMLTSLFLTWFTPGTPGLSFAPRELISAVQPDLTGVTNFISQSPPEVTLFLASFVLATLFLVLMLFDLPSRLLALAAGGLGLGLMLWSGFRIWRGGLKNPLPPELGLNDGGEIVKFAADVMGYGAWAWSLGALLLFIAGLTGFARR